MTIGVGSDAEFFVRNNDNEVVSAIGQLGGSKKHPLITPHGAVQEDGVLAEMNTHPAYSAEEFVKNFNLAKGDMESLLKEKGLSSFTRASFRLHPRHLKHKLARRAGCEQDYCSWDMSLNDRPRLAKTTLRTASAHIHISWPKEWGLSIIRKFKTASAMDLFHAIPGVLYDDDIERRQLYGKAGSCRPKEYGVESRTSSNWWTTSDERIEWTYHQAVKSVSHWDDDKISFSSERIQRTINSHDKSGAKLLIREFGIEIP